MARMALPKDRSPTEPRRSGLSSPTPGALRTEIVKLVALGPGGELWVAHPGNIARRSRARTVVEIGPSAVGSEVLICLAGGSREPVILGVLREPGVQVSEGPPLDLTVNRRRLVIACDEELVFRCGKSTIELRPDGKVVIKGVDVVSSARRTNRIRGGAVRIN